MLYIHFIEKLTGLQGITINNIESNEIAKNHLIKKEKCRESYFNYYTSYEWGKPQYYDLCVNTSSMDLDDLVHHVESYINTNISNNIGKK